MVLAERNVQEEIEDAGLAASAAIFNSAVAAAAIGAAWELGALEELHAADRLDVDEFAKQNDLEPHATTGMFRALAAVGIVRRYGSRIEPGPSFDGIYRDKALFYWLCQGSGEVFHRMAHILRNGNRLGRFYRRDARAISVACREANAQFFDPLFWRAMNDLGCSFSKVADLGSGSGERLVQIVERYPGVRGIGLDIAASAIELAAKQVADRGLEDRISFVVSDVCEIAPKQALRDVELVTCFLMGHDMWPRERCIPTLRRLRAAFPNARKVLLGDTVRTVGLPDEATPVFTLGFEVGHALMGVYVPTIDEWSEAFAEGGWNCVHKHISDELTGTVIFELEPMAF